MRLDAWLKQPHSPAERLRLIERLAQALNAVHDRGETLASIAPDRVEVGNDLKIDLSPATRGRPEPGYAAPERLEGGEPSTAADIYSIGSLCWEVLVGRPCGEAPKPLGEIAPELSRDLASSVMGCLERSPEWRPKDLTYLAQLAASQQKAVREPEPAPKLKAKPERAAPQPRASAAPRAAPRRASRSQLPLLLAAVLLIAAAAASYMWLHRQGADPTVAARSVATPPPAATPLPDPGAAAQAPPASAAVPTPVPSAAAASPTPTPEATAVPTAAPAPTATPEPTPTPLAAPTAEPAEPRAAIAPPVEPASLATVTPLSIKRPGRVLIDLRGAGLRSDLRVRILPIKETPRGITIVRQKWTSASLVSVLLELDANVTPTAYAIALEDRSGALTNPLQLHVTK